MASKHGQDMKSHLPRENARLYPESERLLQRALDLIPLGSQTFSKSHQQFMRGAMPQMAARGTECFIEDVDGNSYIDYVLGLLPIVLGYCDPEVDAAVRDQLSRGITFSLPTALEADLAERLVRLIPCADMVRFGKNGSDATSAAIRLARACTGREPVISYGYHGWHDWYIGATVRHLGVPEAVRDLTENCSPLSPDALLDHIRSSKRDYAAIIVEPATGEEIVPGFLAALRDLTEKAGIILIFDEVVSGFRINLGGAQKEYGVTPDLACFGKAMGNGMPISALVGRRNLMRRVEDIFFSGTFGGEALSLAASIATIDKLERENAIARMRARGQRLMTRAQETIKCHDLGEVLTIAGPDWWPHWRIRAGTFPPNLVNSLLRQSAADNGVLMLSTLNLCLAHDSDAIEDRTIGALEKGLAAVKAALSDRDPGAHLRGEEIRPAFSVRAS